MAADPTLRARVVSAAALAEASSAEPELEPLSQVGVDVTRPEKGTVRTVCTAG